MSKHLISLIFIFIACYSVAQPAVKPVAMYSFNDANSKDETGENDAKAYGAIWAEDRFGNARSACYLQGNYDSYLNLGTDSVLKPEKATISLWVTIDQAVYKGFGADNNPIIFTRSQVDDDFTDAYTIAYQFNIRKLCCNTTLSKYNMVHLYPPKTSYLRQWYHVVMTYDDDNISLYINGVLEGFAAKKFKSKFLKSDSVLVGRRYGLRNQRYFQGTVDDIFIYDKVLSPLQILDLYNASNPKKSSVLIKWILYVLALVTFIFSITLLLKWRIAKAIKKEKEKNQLRNNWYEQENKVLTAQMDPHFIFNSLNTIQQFIIINDNDKAQLYLSKFSRLLRMILESNLKDKISLTEEIKIIEQYLEIESIRFNSVFKYDINIEKVLNPTSIFIPRFLIQPFVENAIWHGLLPKDGSKHLSISFEKYGEKVLCCIIEDNGVGRKFSGERSINKGDRSLAINFIRQRLQLMSKIEKETYDLVITDKTNSEGKSTGTKVTINIPIFKNE